MSQGDQEPTAGHAMEGHEATSLASFFAPSSSFKASSMRFDSSARLGLWSKDN